MGIFKKLLAGSTTELVDKSMTGLDNLFTSKEEKLKARSILTKQYTDLAQDITAEVINEENNVTERQKADMTSDSWLSKNIRPIMIILNFSFLMLFAFIDALMVKFLLRDIYVQFIGAAYIAQVGFYFGGRSLEKREKIMSISKNMYEVESGVKKAKKVFKLFGRK